MREYSSDIVCGLWPIQKLLRSSWQRLPLSQVLRNLRKAWKPIPFSSSRIAWSRGVSQRCSRLLCRYGVLFRVLNSSPFLPLMNACRYSATLRLKSTWRNPASVLRYDTMHDARSFTVPLLLNFDRPSVVYEVLGFERQCF